MSNRKTARLITAPINGVNSFHFTAPHLRGENGDMWYPIKDGNLFASVEEKLIEMGEAFNVTDVSHKSAFFEVTYNGLPATSSYKNETPSKE